MFRKITHTDKDRLATVGLCFGFEEKKQQYKFTIIMEFFFYQQILVSSNHMFHYNRAI